MIQASCGGCGFSGSYELEYEMEHSAQQPYEESTLTSHGWGVYSAWSTDPVFRCPDCVVTDSCTECGDSFLILVASEDNPVCMLYETERLEKLLLPECVWTSIQSNRSNTVDSDSVEDESLQYVRKEVTAQCPECNNKLATDLAKQCLACGTSWHDQ